MFGTVVHNGEVFTIKGFSFSASSGMMVIIESEKNKLYISYNT